MGKELFFSPHAGAQMAGKERGEERKMPFSLWLATAFCAGRQTDALLNEKAKCRHFRIFPTHPAAQCSRTHPNRARKLPFRPVDFQSAGTGRCEIALFAATPSVERK